jgi:hypothetical protein
MAPANETEIRYRIHVLGDDIVTDEDKHEAVEVLVGAGTDAIPFLVERLLDRKDGVFLPRTAVSTGPLHAAPPAVVPTTVRYMVESMLYRIIAPQRRAVANKNALDALKLSARPPSIRPPIPWVADWGLFWRAHKKETLDDIRAWSAEELDRRWDAIDDGQAAPLVPASSVGGPAAPSLGGAELDALKSSYAKARVTFLEARRDRARAAEAKRSLHLLGKQDVRLKVHTDSMAAALDRRG